ncbi:MAG: UDP-N-acetylmuramate:L-alanyl-gamma-D-glutamyl-meso-diaminopimelate ligase [Candidatus Korobacteraceae bacterium]
MKPRHIHLIGICGTAMASLAGMLKQRGFHVTGSDVAAYPPMSDFLAGIGIAVSQPYAEANLKPPPDLVVIGNALSRGNVEVEFVLDQRLPFTSMAALVHEEFLRGREVLTVAGTHGKTTTTSMLAWIFHVAGREPSFLIGGIAENFGSSFAVSEGREFILEGDEYDTAFFDKGPKFMHYFPDGMILTSVEFDHADIYHNLDEIKTAFKRLVNLVPHRGRVIAWDEQGSAGLDQGSAAGSVGECVSRAFCTVERYGFAEDSAWRIRDIRYEPDCTTWRVERHGKPWAEFEFALAGEYNVLNATAAAALAAGYGVDPATIGDALRSFRSVKRRLEVKAEIDGITVIDDFAHHPTAIAVTLKALRTRFAGRRLWVILEPRSNTLRRNVFQQELIESLTNADEVVMASVYFKQSDALRPEERLDVNAIVAELQRRGRPARQVADANAIVAGIAGELRGGDVVAILSNGGFGGIYEKLPARLHELHAC